MDRTPPSFDKLSRRSRGGRYNELYELYDKAAEAVRTHADTVSIKDKEMNGALLTRSWSSVCWELGHRGSCGQLRAGRGRPDRGIYAKPALLR